MVGKPKLKPYPKRSFKNTQQFQTLISKVINQISLSLKKKKRNDRKPAYQVTQDFCNRQLEIAAMHV